MSEKPRPMTDVDRAALDHILEAIGPFQAFDYFAKCFETCLSTPEFRDTPVAPWLKDIAETFRLGAASIGPVETEDWGCPQAFGAFSLARAVAEGLTAGKLPPQSRPSLEGMLRSVFEAYESLSNTSKPEYRLLPLRKFVATGGPLGSEAYRLGMLCNAIDYPAYLASPEWKARRDARVKADGGRCAVCSSTERLNVHHRTYERIGDELQEDLVTLCETCHGIFHKSGRLAKEPS